MNTRTSALKVSLALAGALTLGAGCDQPLPKCSVAYAVSGSGFATTYELVSSEGDCDGMTLPGSADFPGETLFTGNFYKPTGKVDPKDYSPPGPDYDHVRIAIAPLNVFYTGASTNADDKPYAWGEFDDSEPKDDFCTISDMDPARQRLAATPETDDGMGNITPAQPATDTTYDFSNVEVYTTVEDPGRQFRADLTYTKTVDGATCTAKVKVNAVFPWTDCNTYDENFAPLNVMNEAACSGNPTFEAYPVKCHPTLFFCVLTENVPALK